MPELKIAIVRHSITPGNMAMQYVGRTDQPLCTEGIELAKSYSKLMPEVERVYSSPLTRCKQTVAILFPAHEPQIAPGLIECDFGKFEGMTQEELSRQPFFAEWKAQGGIMPFPGSGEDQEGFLLRCKTAFLNVIEELRGDRIKTAATVFHGGSIMAVMCSLGLPRMPFFEWRVKNSSGFMVKVTDENELEVEALLGNIEDMPQKHLLAKQKLPLAISR